MFSTFYQWAVSNQMLTGIVVSGGLAALAVTGKNLLGWLWVKCTRTVFSSLSANNKDLPTYSDLLSQILEWPSWNGIRSWKMADPTLGQLDGENPKEVRTKYPASGTYLGWYKRRPVILRLWEEKQQQGGATYYFEVSVAFGAKLLDELITSHHQNLEGYPKFRIFVPGGRWLPRAHRNLSTLHLAESMAEEMTKDLTNFLKSRPKYLAEGQIYNRKWLLSGPPGGGKSSVISAMATYLKWDVLYVPPEECMYGWWHIAKQAHGRIVVIEDIDAHVLDVGKRTHDQNAAPSPTPTAGQPMSSLSGLLNFLDGPMAPENCVIILSTNHPEKLDPALVRPGRIDRHFKLEYYTFEFATALWSRLRGLPQQEAQTLVAKFWGQHEGHYIMPSEFMERLRQEQQNV